jgi:hypothetical protein
MSVLDFVLIDFVHVLTYPASKVLSYEDFARRVVLTYGFFKKCWEKTKKVSQLKKCTSITQC